MAEATAAVFDAVVERRRAARRQALTIGVVVAAIAGWAAWGTDVNLANLARGMPAFFDLIGRMMPAEIQAVAQDGAPVARAMVGMGAETEPGGDELPERKFGRCEHVTDFDFIKIEVALCQLFWIDRYVGGFDPFKFVKRAIDNQDFAIQLK